MRQSVWTNQWQADYVERLVKEHPRQPGELPTDYFQRLAKLAGFEDAEEVPATSPAPPVDETRLPYKEPQDDLEDLAGKK